MTEIVLSDYPVWNAFQKSVWYFKLTDVTFLLLGFVNILCHTVLSILQKKLPKLKICWKYINFIPSNILKHFVNVLSSLQNEIDLHFSFRLSEIIHLDYTSFDFVCSYLVSVFMSTVGKSFFFCFEFRLSFISRVQLILNRPSSFGRRKVLQ